MTANRLNQYISLIITLLLLFSVFTQVTTATIWQNKTIFNKNTNISSTDTDFDDDILQLMKEAHIPSLSACIIVNESVKWMEGYGCYRGINTLFFQKKPTIHTVYRAYSISKCVTAIAILQLYEKGYFDLDDNVSEYLPFDLKNPNFPDVTITFRMLLNHTSTLGGMFYDLDKWSDNAPPGTTHGYSNTGFAVLEYLIERISGQSFERYCKEHIFEPLDMKNTSFHTYNFKRRQLATPHIWLNRFFIKLPLFDLKIYSGAGGMLTSIEDLSHFLIAHMNNGTYRGVKILNESTIDLMHSPSDPGSYYGLGWMIKGRSSGHGGLGPGYQSEMWMYPSNNTGIIYFWNKYKIPREDYETDLHFAYQMEMALLEKANEFLQ